MQAKNLNQDSSFDHFLEVEEDPMLMNQPFFSSKPDNGDPLIENEPGAFSALICKLYQKVKGFASTLKTIIVSKLQYFKDVGRFELWEKMEKNKYTILAVMILIAFITALILGLQENTNQHQIRLDKIEEEAKAERAKLELEARLVRVKYDKAIKGLSIKMSDEIDIITQDSGILIAKLKARIEEYDAGWGRKEYRERLPTYNETILVEFLSELARELKSKDLNSLLTDLRL